MRRVAHSASALHIKQCASGFISTPLQQNMSTSNFKIFRAALRITRAIKSRLKGMKHQLASAVEGRTLSTTAVRMNKRMVSEPIAQRVDESG